MTISMNEKRMNNEWEQLVAAMKESSDDVREAYSRAIEAMTKLVEAITYGDMSASLKQHMLAIIEEVIE